MNRKKEVGMQMQTKKNWLKKSAAIVLSCAMLIGVAPLSAYAANFTFHLSASDVTVTPTTAKVPVSASVTDDAEIEEIGLYYSEAAANLEDGAQAAERTAAAGNANTFTLTNLKANTTYYCKPFVVYTDDTYDSEETLGSQITFKTAVNATEPKIDLTTCTRATSGTMTLKAAITDNGGSAIKEHGFVYSTSSGGSATGTRVKVSGTSTPFSDASVTLAAKSTAQTYYFWAYAVNNESKTGYSARQTVTVAAAATAPAVSLTGATFSDKTMTLRGSYNSQGGTMKTEGFVYSTSNSSTSNLKIGVSGTNNAPVSLITSASGTFSIPFTVTQGKTYYIRAYAQNEKDITYSAITTVYVPQVTTDSAKVSGTTLTAETSWTKNSGITKKGVMYTATYGAALTSSSWTKKEYTGSSDPFTTAVSGLAGSTKYYVRSYAATANGTSYGAERTVTTADSSANGKPVVETDSISNIDADSARVYIDVTDDGGYSITERGIVYSETERTPTLSTSKTETEEYAGKTGREYETITNLDYDTRYYVRAYAKNSKGTSYGAVKTFTTKDEDYDDNGNGDADIETVEVIDITGGGATVIAQLNDADGSVSEKGFVYDDSTNPTTSRGTKITMASKKTGRYSIDIDDLEPQQTYYVRAYVKTNNGTTYGKSLKFKTNNKPSAQTLESAAVSETGATLNGSVNNPSDEKIVKKGFVYSDSNTQPTTDDTIVEHSSKSEGKFSVSLTELDGDEDYYFRAFLQTDEGITYGSVKEFTTKETTVTVNFKTIHGIQVQTQTINGKSGEKLTENDLDVPQGYELYESDWDYTIDGTDTVNILLTKNEGPFMAGTGNGYFAPDQATTRAEVALAIYNLAAVKTTENNPQYFTDVLSSHHAEDAIAYCSAKGYMNGFPDGTFRPDDRITRVQMAVVLTKLYELSGYPALTFKDVRSDYWGYNYIALVSERGMMNGYPNGTFGFDNTTTRAEVCTLFSNAERRTLEPLGNDDFRDVPPEHWAYDYIMNAAIPE
jgi:hypothetical protein